MADGGEENRLGEQVEASSSDGAEYIRGKGGVGDGEECCGTREGGSERRGTEGTEALAWGCVTSWVRSEPSVVVMLLRRLGWVEEGIREFIVLFWLFKVGQVAWAGHVPRLAGPRPHPSLLHHPHYAPVLHATLQGRKMLKCKGSTAIKRSRLHQRPNKQITPARRSITIVKQKKNEKKREKNLSDAFLLLSSEGSGEVSEPGWGGGSCLLPSPLGCRPTSTACLPLSLPPIHPRLPTLPASSPRL